MSEPDQMEKARAARALLKDARRHDHPDQAEEEMHAFMSIFHPDRYDPTTRYTEEKGNV